MAITKAGLLKTTLLDYPGKIACTVFLPGCNFRCPYCHNRDLVLNSENTLLPIDKITEYIKSKIKVLEGVCITGGEPLIHNDLPELISKIKSYGLKVKIDTNGSFPEKLPSLDADYIAMDIKTDPEKYSLVTGSFIDKNLSDKIRKSIEWIKKSAIDYEFRTTLVPGIVDFEDMKKIASLAEGCRKFTLNKFQAVNTLDIEWEKHISYEENEYQEFINILAAKNIHAILRGL